LRRWRDEIQSGQAADDAPEPPTPPEPPQPPSMPGNSFDRGVQKPAA
jgi:hypothetical protein